MSQNKTCLSILLFDEVSDVKSCDIFWEVAKFCTEFHSGGFVFLKVFCKIDFDAVFFDYIRLLIADLGNSVVTFKHDISSMLLTNSFHSDVFDFAICTEVLLNFRLIDVKRNVSDYDFSFSA